MEYCNQLFMLERDYSGIDENGKQIADPMSTEQRQNARQIQSKPVTLAFYAWLDALEVSRNTALAQAV